MGDHRQDSLDSRYHQDLPGGGTVDDKRGRRPRLRRRLAGQPLDDLPIPYTFDQPGINAAASARGRRDRRPRPVWSVAVAAGPVAPAPADPEGRRLTGETPKAGCGATADHCGTAG